MTANTKKGKDGEGRKCGDREESDEGKIKVGKKGKV